MRNKTNLSTKNWQNRREMLTAKSQKSVMNYIGYEATTKKTSRETKQAKCNGNTINNIGHEETNKQSKELLMPGKLKQSSSLRENV